MKEITCHDLFYKHIAGLTGADYHDIGTDLFIPVLSHYDTYSTISESGDACKRYQQETEDKVKASGHVPAGLVEL